MKRYITILFTFCALLCHAQNKAQTIIFPEISNKYCADSAIFILQASATSGLKVGYRVLNGPAIVNDNILTLTGLGTIILVAYQDGNDDFAQASSVIRRFQSESKYIDSIIQVKISGKRNVCENDTLNVMINSVPGIAYVWNSNKGATYMGYKLHIPQAKIINGGTYQLAFYENKCSLFKYNVKTSVLPRTQIDLKLLPDTLLYTGDTINLHDRLGAHAYAVDSLTTKVINPTWA
ncbi:MAG: hypothetical protein NW207_07880 [Cytophagales bacterium]|nr:hypothetical protein [Cytophagales bacterium]